MIRTLVVEDDPLLADAHRAYTERVPGFEVVGVARRGEEALRLLATTPVDLVLLDFYLPDMGGLDICRTLRARGAAVDVIAVTSARQLETVRAAVSQGVVLYLLKPFTFAAFRDKLESYAEYHRRTRTAETALGQGDVDRMLAALHEPGRPSLPKGIGEQTLAATVRALREAGTEPATARAVGERLGVSRITARRYLEYLVERGLAARAPHYGGPGRPEHRYTWHGDA
ncbi:response regulator [Allostreptomyces psammosilenae]|uniref:Transcriptional regulatory protein n=1 Tax=Allostreptomyces psammosilenae TaxID=1892865 RepID=A0A853A0U4_9ACTN|nr:response regulator [Allostreptomyces psammosilenae]NYI08233.1 response regulator of citrate/malate metabolism [Allostreptomyces psammosilenae]